MKRVILLALLMPYMAFGQIVENFESGTCGNWIQSSEARWIADTTASISGNYSLHHSFDNAVSGTDRIGLKIKNLHPEMGIARWSFLVRHGYDPSSSNCWSVFLISDSDPGVMSPDGNTNGFAIGVNLTGYDDTLRLWKVKSNVLIPVVNCRINWQNEIGTADAVKINTERTPEGTWSVSVSKPDGTCLSMATGSDMEMFNPDWFGIYYKYSASRDMLLWIDDVTIDGVFYKDSTPPSVIRCEATGKKSMKITFSEPVIDELMIPANFSISQDDNKSISVQPVSSLIYNVVFSDEFRNRKENILIINKICDNSENCSSVIQIPFTPAWAERGDVVITEIMADPVPEVSLPGKEYIEITNRTNVPINLNKWKLFCGNNSCLFPDTEINPSEIMIICSVSDTSAFTKFGRVEGVKSFPTLTDGGNIIYLTDSLNVLISGVEYTSDWYSDGLKSGGGWSLEMIDSGYPFYSDGNWRSSSSRDGGTPGSVNSVSRSNQDISFYGIRNVFAYDSITVAVRFSEPVFCLKENIGHINISEVSVADISPVDPLFREFLIRPADPLIPGKIYQFNISGDVEDFAGNSIQNGTFEFGLSETISGGDIMFNELLFNPLPGDPDYIEFFNTSQKIIDASGLQVVSVNDDSGDTSDIFVLSDERRCIKPGSYYAVTTSVEKTSDRYLFSDPANIFETGSLPSMPDDEGHLILYSRELEKLDEVFYNEDMHYSLLTGFTGVALEKSKPSDRSDEAANWHSASESKGWGTPGAPNSIFAEIPAISDKVIFSSTRITPDGDGYEDNLIMQFNLEGNENVVSVTVFDETGDYIRKVAYNVLAANDMTLIWDGTKDDGSAADTGIYIVLITLFDNSGKTVKWKKVCTVIR